MRLHQQISIAPGDKAKAPRMGDQRRWLHAKNGRMGGAMAQSQILRDELDIDDAASGQFQIPGIILALFFRNQRAHVANGLVQGARVTRLAQHACNRRSYGLPKGAIACDNPRARERHMLPGLRLLPLIGDEAAQLRGRRALPARWAQTHVDIVKTAPPRGHGQG